VWPLLVCLLGPAGSVVAPTETPGEAPDVTRVVVLVPPVSDRRIADTLASVRSNLPAGEVELVDVVFDGDGLARRIDAADDAAAVHDARGVFWFDLRDGAEYRVYLYLPARAELLRRRVPEASQSVEAAIEAMWIIVRSGALALAKGSDVAMEAVDPASIEPPIAPAKPPVPTPTPAPAPGDGKPAPPKPIGLWLSASYYGLGLSESVPWQSGGGLELSYALHRLVKLGLAYGIVGGLPVSTPAELKILRHELAAVLGVGGLVSKRVRIEGRLLPAIELMQWRAQGDRGVEPAGKLASELLVRVHLVPRLTLDVAAGADVSFSDFDFVLCADGASECSGEARRVVLSPWRVRPRARVGLSVVF
jgi:hypothetical protein